MIGHLQRILERVRAIFRQDAHDHEFDAEAAAQARMFIDVGLTDPAGLAARPQM